MPTTDELRARIGEPEGPYVERKSANPKDSEILQTVVAFANTVGDPDWAVLYLGVRDNGEIQGVPVEQVDGLQKRVRRVCEIEAYPPIRPARIEPIKLGNEMVVAVAITESKDKPHFAGPAYVRRGSESVNATEAQYNDLIASRHEVARVLLRWKQEAINLTVFEIDFDLEDLRSEGRSKRVRQCRIVACTGQSVEIVDLASDRHFAIPLRHVTLSKDLERQRPAILVRQ